MNTLEGKKIEFTGCFTVARADLLQITPVKLSVKQWELTMSNENEEIYLHAEKIDKIYPGTKALDQVSFDIEMYDI